MVPLWVSNPPTYPSSRFGYAQSATYPTQLLRRTGPSFYSFLVSFLLHSRHLSYHKWLEGPSTTATLQTAVGCIRFTIELPCSSPASTLYVTSLYFALNVVVECVPLLNRELMYPSISCCPYSEGLPVLYSNRAFFSSRRIQVSFGFPHPISLR